ncbi:MAG: acetylornithine deacetylase [Henriciella sp.]|nr:acetylornithine deacetylase [Henriciella sp.]
MTDTATVTDRLAKLISFDTTSRNSNLDLITWVEEQLIPLGFDCRRIENSEGNKSNLWARIGPDVPGGLVLSGHSDVVPVDGQHWDTDPFDMTEINGRLFGRGTSDMKGFLALCLAFAPKFATLDLKKPIHFAFSYDEEVGCQGAPLMIDDMVERGARPDAVWVGEPTLWQVVSGHKGIMLTKVVVTGREAHSSLPHLGVSANGEAVDLMMVLRDIERDLAANADPDSPFDPPYPTLSIGELHGGTATNILARECEFHFDLRCPPGYDPDEILAPFLKAAAEKDAALKARYPECGVEVTKYTDVPGLAPGENNAAETLVRALTGDNALRAVAYATEAGQFHQAGMAAVICGPGSIDQAHKPNEFVDKAQLTQGVKVFNDLIAHLKSVSP